MRKLAAVVTQKNRGDLALKALESLRPQVDRLCLYLNGYTSWPDWLPNELVDSVHYDLYNEFKDLGNLAWAPEWEGLYLSCDDDLTYAPTYASIMEQWIDRFRGACLVTTHGLRFGPGATVWRKQITTEPIKVLVKGTPKMYGPRKTWVNGWTFQSRWDTPLMHHEWIHQPGSGVMAFDTRSLVPHMSDLTPGEADLSLALWAYHRRVPVLCIPHGGWECEDILPPGADSLWAASKQTGFERRNRLIKEAAWTQTFQVD